MDFFFEHIKHRMHPSSEEILEDLIDFHTKKPGMTEVTYGSARTENGQRSYEILAQVLNGFSGSTVLDLACGNGPLIELILRHYPDVGRVIGIDLCRNELRSAKGRINNNRAEFKCEPVQNLSLGSESIDYVLCHLAFFLFEPIEEAVNTIHRVLKRGGKFSAIISGLDDSEEDYNQIVNILQSEVGKENQTLKNFGWGDPRTLNEKGLRSLFDHRFNEDLEFSNFNLVVSGKPAELASRLFTFFYASDLLNEERKISVLKKWTEHFKRKSNGTEFQFNFPLTRLVATKR